jgi:hypothetical protein
MYHLQERAVATNMSISQHLREIADGLMSMDAEKQRDGLRHGAILQKELRAQADVWSAYRTRDLNVILRVAVRKARAVRLSDAEFSR